MDTVCSWFYDTVIVAKLKGSKKDDAPTALLPQPAVSL